MASPTFLLDTNVVSELRKAESGRANANVVRWAAEVPPERFWISAISILELEIGVLRIERRDEDQAAALRTWHDEQVLPSFEGRILSIDAAVALRCARFHVPDPRPDRDSLIAATALVHGMSVATRNVSDFEGLGVELLNPWDT